MLAFSNSSWAMRALLLTFVFSFSVLPIGCGKSGPPTGGFSRGGDEDDDEPVVARDSDDGNAEAEEPVVVVKRLAANGTGVVQASASMPATEADTSGKRQRATRFVGGPELVRGFSDDDAAPGQESVQQDPELGFMEHFRMDPDESAMELFQARSVRVFSDDSSMMLVAIRDDVHIVDTWSGETNQKVNLGGLLVSAVAFSPDGSTMAVGTRDGKIQLRTLRDFSQLDEYARYKILRDDSSRPPVSAHEGEVTTLHFLPDGDGLASGGADGRVCIWNFPFDAPRTILEPKEAASIIATGTSSDAQTAMALTDAGQVYLCDTIEGELNAIVEDKDSPIVRAALSPRGTRLATCDAAGKLRLWNAGTGRPVGHFPTVEGGLAAIGFSPDDKSLLAVTAAGELSVWKFPDDSEGERTDRDDEWTVASDDVAELSEVKHGQIVFVELLIAAEGEATATSEGVNETTSDSTTPSTARLDWGCAKIEADSNIVVYGSDGEKQRTIEGGGRELKRLWTTTDGRDLIVGGYQAIGTTPDKEDTGQIADRNWFVSIYSATDGSLKRDLAYRVEPLSVATTGDSKRLAITLADQRVVLVDERSALVVQTVPTETAARAVALSAAGDRMIVFRDEAVSAHDIPSRLAWQSHKDRVNSIGFSPDGTLLTTAGLDNAVNIYDWRSGKRVWKFDEFRLPPGLVKFNHDQSRLLIAGLDSFLHFWAFEPTETENASADWPEYSLYNNSPVMDASFSDDDPNIAYTVDVNGLLRYWDLRDRKVERDERAAREQILKFHQTDDARKSLLVLTNSGLVRRLPTVPGVIGGEDRTTSNGAVGRTRPARNDYRLPGFASRNDEDEVAQLTQLNENAIALATARTIEALSVDVANAEFDLREARTSVERDEARGVVKQLTTPQERAPTSSDTPKVVFRVATNYPILNEINEYRPIRLAISDDGRQLHAGFGFQRRTRTVITGAATGFVESWDIPTERHLRKWIKLPTTILRGLAVGADSRHVFPVPAQAWFDEATGFMHRTDSMPASFAMSPDGATAAIGLYGAPRESVPVLLLVNTADGKILKQYEAFEAATTALAFGPDGKTLIASIRERLSHRLVMFDSALLAEMQTIETENYTGSWIDNNGRRSRGTDMGVEQIIFSPTNGSMVTHGAYPDGFHLKYWKKRGDTWPEEPVSDKTNGNAFFQKVPYGTVGTFLGGRTEMALQSKEGVSIVDIREAKLKDSIKIPPVGRRRAEIVFSPDSKHVVAGSGNGTIQVWSLTRADRPPKEFRGHSAPVIGLCLSPDGKYLASASEENDITVWDFAAWEPTARPSSAPAPEKKKRRRR